jgi:SAM-dependent methyltransferase
MYVNGEYFTNNPDWDIADAQWKVAVICRLLKKNNIQVADVIEVGCGAGENLVELAKHYPGIKKLRGYDISPHAIALASTRSSEQVSYFNEDLAADNTVGGDLLLVIDVIEHVDDFYGFLRKMRTKGKHFVMHIPLDLSCRTLLKPHVLLQQRRSVGHIHYFSKEMVEWALADTGYTIVDWVYTKPVVDIEPARTLKRWVKKMLRNTAFALHKDRAVKKWGGYSIMVLAK